MVEPLGGFPISCADIRERTVDVTLTTTRGVNLHLAAGFVDRGTRARPTCATSDAARVIASYLRCHPRVCEVRYPGLRDDPSYSVASRVLQGGFGPYVDYRADGGWCRVEATEDDVHDQVMALERLLGQGSA